MASNQLNFVYQLEGEVSEIDVFKLAPTLLSLGALIQESNRALFPDGPEISVNVKPFREGSFIVDLSLFQASNFKQLLDFLTPHSIEQLQALLESIGLVSGGTGATVFGAVKAIKFLRGKPANVETIAPGQVRLTTSDNKSITVDESTNILLHNSSVVNNIFRVFNDPLESQPSVTDVKTYIREKPESAMTVDRGDIPGFREYAQPSPLPVSSDETTKETTHSGVFLNPKRGAFGDDPKDWSFYRGDEVITATIRDREFLQRYANGEYRLNQADLLTVDLLERQRVKGTVVLKPTYEIIRVTNYQKGYTQPPLLP